MSPSTDITVPAPTVRSVRPGNLTDTAESAKVVGVQVALNPINHALRLSDQLLYQILNDAIITALNVSVTLTLGRWRANINFQQKPPGDEI